MLTQQHTPCVNARQLLLRPLFAQPALLCLPLGSRWKEMAFGPENEARQLQAPASRILQHLCSSCSHPGCSVAATHQHHPNSKLHRALGATGKCTHHSITQLPRSRENDLLSFPCNRDMEEKKKPPTLHRCKQQQLQHPRWNLCTSQCKVHQGKKISIQVFF